MIARTLGEVFLAGDIAYPQGTAANFTNCFNPYWGHAAGRWHPVPGNHEYDSGAVAPTSITSAPPPERAARVITSVWSANGSCC